MGKYRLLYSFGLSRGCHHYTDDDEMFIDLKTLKFVHGEGERRFGESWIILAGKTKRNGLDFGYYRPEIPWYELAEKYFEFLESNDGQEKIAIEKLLNELKFKPSDFMPGKYPNRYCVQS